MDNSGFYSYLSVHVLFGLSRKNSCDNLKFFSWTKRMRSGWTALFPLFSLHFLSWKLRQGVYQSQCSLETTWRCCPKVLGFSWLFFFFQHVICRSMWDIWHLPRQKEEEERQRFEEASRFKADIFFDFNDLKCWNVWMQTSFLLWAVRIQEQFLLARKLEEAGIIWVFLMKNRSWFLDCSPHLGAICVDSGEGFKTTNCFWCQDETRSCQGWECLNARPARLLQESVLDWCTVVSSQQADARPGFQSTPHQGSPGAYYAAVLLVTLWLVHSTVDSTNSYLPIVWTYVLVTMHSQVSMFMSICTCL